VSPRRHAGRLRVSPRGAARSARTPRRSGPRRRKSGSGRRRSGPGRKPSGRRRRRGRGRRRSGRRRRSWRGRRSGGGCGTRSSSGSRQRRRRREALGLPARLGSTPRRAPMAGPKRARGADLVTRALERPPYENRARSLQDRLQIYSRLQSQPLHVISRPTRELAMFLQDRLMPLPPLPPRAQGDWSDPHTALDASMSNLS
jgi:hypothetical protein